MIVDNLYNKITSLFSKNLINNIEFSNPNCKERIIEMNKRYEEIKSNPFTYIDPFYEIHGSHRNRKHEC